MAERLTGTIRTLREGYGFITPNQPGVKDHFFHKSNLTAGKHAFALLVEGLSVEFTPGADPDHAGPRAEAIDILS